VLLLRHWRRQRKTTTAKRHAVLEMIRGGGAAGCELLSFSPLRWLCCSKLSSSRRSSFGTTIAGAALCCWPSILEKILVSAS